MELMREISTLKSEIRALEQALKATDETGVEVLADEKAKTFEQIGFIEISIRWMCHQW